MHSRGWHAYQNGAKEGADEDDFKQWKTKNNNWIQPGGNKDNRKTGIVYVVRPKPGQENFIKVGSTNEIWDRFKNRYREYLPGGFEMYAVAQYAGMTKKEEEDIKTEVLKTNRFNTKGRKTQEEVDLLVDEMSKKTSENRALEAERKIQANLRETIGEGSYYDKKRKRWQGVRDKDGEWFDVKRTKDPESAKSLTFDNPNKTHQKSAPDRITAKADNYIPFILDMVKQQGRYDKTKLPAQGGQMRYFNGYDIERHKSLKESYQKRAGMYTTRKVADALDSKLTTTADDMDKRLRGKRKRAEYKGETFVGYGYQKQRYR